MIKYSRILFPTDFSPNSYAALEHARILAKTFGSRLHILHVLPEAWNLVPEPGTLQGLPPGFDQGRRETAEKGLRALAAQFAADVTEPTIAVRDGSEFVEIVRYAREHQIELITLGTHGRSALMHMLLGSVAENVVRKAPCPVLTVRPDNFKFVLP